MREVILLLASLLFASCVHNYENTSQQKEVFNKRRNEPFDTLICSFASCTECLDLFIIQGKLTLPIDIKKRLQDTHKLLSDTFLSDIKVCGNFPKDLIDMTSLNFDSNLAFKIVGKTILVDTNNAIGGVPLFYVTEWTKFHYGYNSWMEKSDMEYPHRKEMVDDIIQYLSLKGQSLSKIRRLLGQPNNISPTEIRYDVETKYGTDIDPISSTTLVLKYNNDSLITEVRKDEWKKSW